MIKRDHRWVDFLPGWKESKAARAAWIYIFIIGIFAVIGPLIANEKPYYCKLEGKSYFPLFTNVTPATLSLQHPAFSPVNWNTTAFESVWRAVVPYSHFTIDLKGGAWMSPFDPQPIPMSLRHWLGTDGLGRDVLSGMIRGCRVSLLIGVGSMLIAFLIGVPLGAIAAYWGNRGKRIARWQMIVGVILLMMLIGVLASGFLVHIKIFASIVLVGLLIALLFLINPKGKTTVNLPIDHVVNGMITVVDGFPGIFLILILIAILPFQGWAMIMIVIAFLQWPVMGRYMRAEVLKLKETAYIKAAQIINLPPYHIIRYHILPYTIRPVMISFVFGIASAILVESSLSFLGIGLSPEQMNWGRLLAQARTHFDAWWLVLFPGCAIFFTLLSFYVIGNRWQQQVIDD